MANGKFGFSLKCILIVRRIARFRKKKVLGLSLKELLRIIACLCLCRNIYVMKLLINYFLLLSILISRKIETTSTRASHFISLFYSYKESFAILSIRQGITVIKSIKLSWLVIYFFISFAAKILKIYSVKKQRCRNNFKIYQETFMFIQRTQVSHI